jgi:hypothetical protein
MTIYRKMSASEYTVNQELNCDNVSISQSLETELYKLQMRSIDGKYFIPDDSLGAVLGQRKIRAALRDTIPALTEDKIKHYADTILRSFRKIFTILVLTDMTESIETFLEQGVDDSMLPMPDPRPFLMQRISSNRSMQLSKDRELFLKWDRIFGSRQSHCVNFFRSQWSVSAPTFHSVDQVKHFSLTQNHILPFLDEWSAMRLLENSESTIDDLDTGRLDTTGVTYGGYSEVQKLTIHPAHYDFGNYNVSLIWLKPIHFGL